MATVIGRNIYIGNIKRNVSPIALTGTFDISAWYNSGDVFNVQSSIVYDDGTESPLSIIQEKQLLFPVVVFDTNVIEYSSFIGSNAVAPLTIADGGGPIHPRVLDLGQQWNGYRYAMAFTPYQAQNNNIENTSIAVSNEPPSATQSWVNPGVINPIFPEPVDGYNSDSELVFDEANDLVWLVNRQDTTLGNNIISIKSSSDWVTWSAAITIFDVPSHLLSPTIVRDGNVFRAWFIGGGGANWGLGTIYTSTCPTMDGVWTTLVPCLQFNPIAGAWHLSVNKVDRQYHAFVYNNTTKLLYFSQSLDPMQFHFAPIATPMLVKGTAGSWDETTLYQSSGVLLANGNYGLYYTGWNATSNTNIGFTEIPVTLIDASASIMSTDGLLGLFKMDELSGEPIDTFGSMTAIATPLSRDNVGRLGKAFKFQGGNMKITGVAMKSFSMWIDFENFPGTFAYLLDARTSGTAYYGKGSGLSSGVSKVKIFGKTITSNNEIASYTTSGYVHLYVELSAAMTGEITWLNRYTNVDPVHASIDNLSVWNKNLSDAELNALINNQFGITL